MDNMRRARSIDSCVVEAQWGRRCGGGVFLNPSKTERDRDFNNNSGESNNDMEAFSVHCTITTDVARLFARAYTATISFANGCV